VKRGHVLALGGAGLLVVLLWWSMAHPTGHMNQPPEQASPDDDLSRLTDPHPDHPLFCQPEDHHAGYTYTPHRYPRTVGGEITALIHRGFSPMRVPDVADVQWLIAPPSEVSF
jgi:hypothetical protein